MLAILPKGFETQMIFGVQRETRIFLLSVLLGALFGIGYEVFRILRRVIRHNDAAVFLQDFLYTVLCAVCYYVFVTALAWGQLRGFVFFGCLIGMITEMLTIGSAVTSAISVAVKGTLRWAVVKPVAVIVRIATKAGRKFVQSSKSLVKHLLSAKKRLKEDEKMVYNK